MFVHKYAWLHLRVVAKDRRVDERVDKHYLCEILYRRHVYEVTVVVEFYEVEYMQEV